MNNFIIGQNWTSVISTNLNVNGAYSVDIFTNGSGNHIIVQESNALKYYKLDVNGTATTPVTLESSSVVSPSISGDATRLFVVYRKSTEDYIRTKYSGNGGASWSDISNLTNPSGGATSLESVFSNNRLHVTYQISNVIYYAKYEGSSWSSPATVSTNENGTGPRIAALFDVDDDKVYFYYEKANTDIGKWREYNVSSNSWGTLWEGYSLSSVQYSGPSGFRVDNSQIYLYYWYYAQDVFGDWHYYFNWVVKNKSNNNTVNVGTPDMQQPGKIYSTTTVNETNHTVFYYTWLAGESQYEVGIWRSDISDGYPSDLVYEYTDTYYPYYLNLSSSSNDVYVIWQDGIGGNNLRLIYDDQNPLAPQNLAITALDFGEYSHPALSWSFNNEPDVYANDNAYEIQRRTRQVPGNFGNWSTIGYTDGDRKSYTDYEIIIEGSGSLYQAEYRIRAIDVGNYTSGWSSTVSIYFGQFGKISNRIQRYEYELSQNYPNPFNPSTTINYSIKSAGEVTLKVYDMLGTEVASLVNERKEPGNYSVAFNATNIPSGIYVYRLTADKFVETKKLILLK